MTAFVGHAAILVGFAFALWGIGARSQSLASAALAEVEARTK